MKTVFLLLGGNIGDRLTFITEAKEMISQNIGNIVKSSSIYETDPWGFESNEIFLNQAIAINTKLTPIRLLSECQSIEKSLGRTRNHQGYTSRTIDIDILLYGDIIHHTPELQIPHIHLHKRKFALIPLSEIAGNRVHPLLKKTIDNLLVSCNDGNIVKPCKQFQRNNKAEV